MKKDLLGPAALFVFLLAAFPATFVFSSQAESSVSETARTLQTIAPYRSWGKANKKPIVISKEDVAAFG
jgi:hypothetical protein